MSQYDLMKLFSRYDSEISEGDFTPDELEEYLAFCDGREDAPSPAEWAADRQYLMTQVRALVGRYSRLGDNAYYHLFLKTDDSFKAAVAL